MQLPSAIVGFYLFYDGAVDMQIRVLLTVKDFGHLGFFLFIIAINTSIKSDCYLKLGKSYKKVVSECQLIFYVLE